MLGPENRVGASQSYVRFRSRRQRSSLWDSTTYDLTYHHKALTFPVASGRRLRHDETYREV
jgi:hypothetical protein